MASNGNMINEIGNVYGRLTVIKRVERRRNEQYGVRWLCKCECGNATTVLSNNLRSGQTSSCGCLRKLPEGESSLNKFIAVTKKHAKQRGYIWELSKEQVRTITKSNCYYCGCEPNQKYNIRKYENGQYIYNGIDRIDNTKGYTIDNVVPCCGKCNWMKSNLSLCSFRETILRIYNHWASKS